MTWLNRHEGCSTRKVEKHWPRPFSVAVSCTPSTHGYSHRCSLGSSHRSLGGFSLQVLLKLFSYCVKVKVNRQQLVKLEMNTLNVMLGTLNLVRSVGYVYDEEEALAHLRDCSTRPSPSADFPV